jgi:RNA polymerase sigma factor (TIGR02999 family)
MWIHNLHSDSLESEYPMPQSNPSNQMTVLLEAIERGESKAAEELLPLVYDELRRVADMQLANQRGRTLQATALVHEAWIRLVKHGDPGFRSRQHFYSAAAQAMRHILVDQQRRRVVPARGMGETPIPADPVIECDVEDVIAVHEAIEQLEAEHPEMAQLVVLRFFGGLSMGEIAKILGQPLRSVERLWAYARVWLRHEIHDLDDEAGAEDG